MMYPQAFNNQNPIVPPMANNLQKTTMNNYLPQNHINIINHQPNNLGTNSLNKQHNLLTYGNTKPLTHFNADLSQRMTPPMANPSKNPLMPYMQPQQQPPQQPPQQQPPPPPPQLQAPRAHLSEDQKRMLLMKQKGVMNQPMAYAALPSHGQVSVKVRHAWSTAPRAFQAVKCDALRELLPEQGLITRRNSPATFSWSCSAWVRFPFLLRERKRVTPSTFLYLNA